jgi:hypothetical protein
LNDHHRRGLNNTSENRIIDTSHETIEAFVRVGLDRNNWNGRNSRINRGNRRRWNRSSRRWDSTNIILKTR